MEEKQLSFFEGDNPDFERLSHQNGALFWYASTLLKVLGYKEFKINATPILKARQVCTNAGIDDSEHFIRFENSIDGKSFVDLKLTRFACYLVVMNADIKKPNVAKAQAYFAYLTNAIQQYFIDTQEIERIDLRSQISEHEKTLSSTAKQQGIVNYAYFQNKGYMGLYNMPLAQIKKIKGIPENRTPFDFMGAEEMGANIFRITQTNAKIKRENIKGQQNLEQVAFSVGQKVRQTMEDMGSEMPETLPISEDIKHIKSELKRTRKAFSKKDKIKPSKTKKIKDSEK